MSLFRRNEIWYASYSLPGEKRIKESLGTKDKRQAQELHDKRKAELWRVEKLGDLPDVTFDVTNGAIVIHTQRLKSDPGGNLLS